MESKKDIGKLFRENLEQLDYTPSTKVWEQIELDLKKKKKRRFFLWFFFTTIFLSGILIGIGHTFSENNSITNKDANETSVSNKKNSERSKQIIIKQENPECSDSTTSIVNTNSNSKENQKQNSTAVSNKNVKKNKAASRNNLYVGDKNKLHQNSAVTSVSLKNKKERKSKNKSSIVRNNSFEKIRKNLDQYVAEAKRVSATAIANDSKAPTSVSKNSIDEGIEKRLSIDSLIGTTATKKTKKKDKKEKDSLPVQDSVTEVKEKSKEYEIIIAPYYGLNYNGYFGDFNAISNNAVLEKTGDIRAVYGIMARWMFTSKLGVQIGAGKINNRYFSTVDKNGNTFINTQNVATDIPVAELNGQFANATKVKFTYESTFIEVPLEAYYVIRDKKLGLATSFGVSLLFSGKNSIFAASENIENIKIGTLTTASPTGATGNAKLYLFYKITSSLQIDLYPSFQFQVMGNTDSSNYSSYFFSIRAGLSYKL